MVSVSISGAGTPVIGTPTIVFDRADLRMARIIPDGSFVAVRNLDGVGNVTELKLIVNWLDTLPRLAPAR